MGSNAGKPKKKRIQVPQLEESEDIIKNEKRYEERKSLYLSGTQQDVIEAIEMFNFLSFKEGHSTKVAFFKKVLDFYKSENYPEDRKSVV